MVCLCSCIIIFYWYLYFITDIEEVSEKLHGKEAVVMRNVKKEFGSNGMKKVAVNGLTLTLYEDQITAFLGHNGAGNYFHYYFYVLYCF